MKSKLTVNDFIDLIFVLIVACPYLICYFYFDLSVGLTFIFGSVALFFIFVLFYGFDFDTSNCDKNCCHCKNKNLDDDI